MTGDLVSCQIGFISSLILLFNKRGGLFSMLELKSGLEPFKEKQEIRLVYVPL